MKCTHCSTEIPAQSEFCPKCGTRIGGQSAAANSSSTVFPAPAGKSRKPLAYAIAALVLLAAGLLGWTLLSRSRGNVLEAQGKVAPGGPLTDKTGRVSPGGPLLANTGTPDAPPPQDVVDYLRFLKEIEKQRGLIHRAQVSEVLKQSVAIQAGGLKAEMSEHPEEGHAETYAAFQQSLATMSAQWQQLSQQFLSKQAPSSCAGLRDHYYDVLGKTSGSIAKIGNSVSQAMAGDSSKALDTLTNMQGSGAGSASAEISQACESADEELAGVCKRFRINKDFDIKDDLGGSPLLGR